MGAGSIALAILMVYFEGAVSLELTQRFPWLLGANAEGARSILAAIAGSMITVAGVTFSITIVALALASNQYTSRILRNFMRDRWNQVVLGMFISVFVYCLIVLRTIRGGEEEFIPSYSLNVGMLLALAAIGFLIFFVHHISSSLQASAILANIYRETLEVMENLYGEERQPTEPEEGVEQPDSNGSKITFKAAKTGYIQDVDEEGLIQWAEEHKVVLQMLRRIGEFVPKGAPLIRVYGQENLKDSAEQTLNAHFTISITRTIEQDPGFGFRQIVDIALKALSPGINDSTTAASCVDYLGALIFRLTQLNVPSLYCCRQQKLRLIAKRADFQFLLDQSFHEIRQHARSNLMIYLRMLKTLSELTNTTLSLKQRQAIWDHGVFIAGSAQSEISLPQDRATFNKALAQMASALQMDYASHQLLTGSTVGARDHWNAQ